MLAYKKKRRTYNYNPYISDWMRSVEQGEVHSCREQKQLMTFLRPILDDPNVYIDGDAVEEYILLTEKYFFPLIPAQKFIAALLIGCRYRDTNFLVFPETLIMAGRGFGKNGFISTLAFYFTSDKNDIKNYHVDIVATSEEQAKTSFEEVYNTLIDMGPKAKKLYKYNLVEIQYKKTRSKIRYRTSNAKTKDGGRPGMVIFDEIHAYENYENIKVFQGGLGKVPDGRIVYITTDGEIRESVMDDYKETARAILEGERPFNGLLPIIFKLDTIQEVGKQELWDKANPRILYDDNLKRQIEREYGQIGYNEELKVAFITKRMNLVYTSKDIAVASREDILATADHEWPDLYGAECIGAVDFADLRDFASVGLRFKRDGKTYFIQHSFIHEQSIEMTNYNINIDEAVAKGWATLVKTSDYPTINPKLIFEWFQKMASKYYIKQIHCDSFRASALIDTFHQGGYMDIKQIRSGAISHNKVAPQLLQMFSDRTLVLEDDKLMRWYISNVQVITDKKGNKTFTKIEPIRRKTDGFFCLLHSLIDDDLEESYTPTFLEPIFL